MGVTIVHLSLTGSYLQGAISVSRRMLRWQNRSEHVHVTHDKATQVKAPYAMLSLSTDLCRSTLQSMAL